MIHFQTKKICCGSAVGNGNGNKQSSADSLVLPFHCMHTHPTSMYIIMDVVYVCLKTYWIETKKKLRKQRRDDGESTNSRHTRRRDRSRVEEH